MSQDFDETQHMLGWAKNQAPWILLVLFGIGLCTSLVLLVIIDATRPDLPIRELMVGETNYVLTCRPQLDGPVALGLWACIGEFDASCDPLSWGGVHSISCNDNDLQIVLQDGAIKAIDPVDVYDPQGVLDPESIEPWIVIYYAIPNQ